MTAMSALPTQAFVKLHPLILRSSPDFPQTFKFQHTDPDPLPSPKKSCFLVNFVPHNLVVYPRGRR